MKNGYRILYILILAIILTTCILLVFSPDTVPVHYNMAGEIDRMGSKYEMLIFPAMAVPVGVFFGWMAGRYGNHPGDEKTLVISGICVLAVMGLLGIYFQIQGILYAPMHSGVLRLKVVRLTVMAIGLLLVILGNVMPKGRRNAFFGLRTKWSLSSDTVWQKSQRFGGITSVVCGVTMILLAAFFDGTACLVMSMVLAALWGIVSIAASYRYYRAENAWMYQKKPDKKKIILVLCLCVCVILAYGIAVLLLPFRLSQTSVLPAVLCAVSAFTAYTLGEGTENKERFGLNYVNTGDTELSEAEEETLYGTTMQIILYSIPYQGIPLLFGPDWMKTILSIAVFLIGTAVGVLFGKRKVKKQRQIDKDQ